MVNQTRESMTTRKTFLNTPETIGVLKPDAHGEQVNVKTEVFRAHSILAKLASLPTSNAEKKIHS